MHILFNGTESTFGYFEATRRYIDQHGKPLAFYSDKASIFRINKASATGGDGHTQFGRALYNAMFGKAARNSHDAHRSVRPDEDLDSIFAWREQRKVKSNLTLHYERKLYLLAYTPTNRKYAGKHLDVYLFPGGKLEIRAAGVKVPYSTYDKLGTIDQGAIVENIRLGHALRISRLVQAERDS